MKNSTSNKKRSRLTLAREAIRTLQVPQLEQVQGGMMAPSCDMGTASCEPTK